MQNGLTALIILSAIKLIVNYLPESPDYYSKKPCPSKAHIAFCKKLGLDVGIVDDLTKKQVTLNAN